MKAKRRKAAKAAYVQRTYAITDDEYQAVYEAQGGVCAICRRANDRYKHLAVDHDHSCCPGSVSCGKCVRALLCKPCNRDVLGHLRDDPGALRRAIDVVETHPAQAVLTHVRGGASECLETEDDDGPES